MADARVVKWTCKGEGGEAARREVVLTAGCRREVAGVPGVARRVRSCTCQ